MLCGAQTPNKYSDTGYLMSGFRAKFLVTGPVDTGVVTLSLGAAKVFGWTGGQPPIPGRAPGDPPSATAVYNFGPNFDGNYRVSFWLVHYGGFTQVNKYDFNVICSGAGGYDIQPPQQSPSAPATTPTTAPSCGQDVPKTTVPANPNEPSFSGC